MKKYKLQTRAQNVDRTVFPSLIGQVWSTSFTKQQLQSGFRATGLCPLNRQAIPDVRLAVSAPYSQENESQEPVSLQSPEKSAECISPPPPTPQLHLHLKGYFTLLLQQNKTTQPSRKRRCEVRVYGEALTSDEVFERIATKEAEKNRKARNR